MLSRTIGLLNDVDDLTSPIDTLRLYYDKLHYTIIYTSESIMTNYSFRPGHAPQLGQSQNDIFTKELRRRVAQSKAERKALLDRVQAQRERAYRQLLKKRKRG